MKAIILHLSDIHFKAQRGVNKILEREEALAAAVQRLAESADTCFIVLSGDIAFSGKAAEYALAIELINRLKDLLKQANSSLEVNIIAVPGNHDCDFSTSSGTRTYILEKVGIKDPAAVNEDVVGELTAVQDAFFEFASALGGGSSVKANKGPGRLYYERRFGVGNHTISFHCFNAAWMSQLHEPQGQMVFPIQLVEWSDEETDLAVAVFHHPDRWLESNNSRPFRDQIEQAANLILTGHEHNVDRFTKIGRSGAVNLYVEGAALQDSDDPRVSGFNVIEIDFDTKRKRVTSFALAKGIYDKIDESEWQPFQQSLRLRAKGIANNQVYAEWLTEVGLPLTHRSQHTLRLPDIFVYPELDSLNLERKQGDGTIDLIIPSEKVAFDNPFLIITGADQSGKTSLAKMIYREFALRGFVPVMVRGERIKSVNDDELLKVVDQQFIREYSSELVERFRQLPRQQRVLMIDDFEDTAIRNREGHSKIIERFRLHFDRIVILASDLFQFAELAQADETESVLSSFRHVQIREFSSQLRYRLIKKWVMFDRDFTTSEQELEHEIDDYANKAATLTLRGNVPSYPVILLSMLQMFDVNQDVTDKGEFGYFYESYIMRKIGQNRTQAVEMGTIMGFAANLGYLLFERRKRSLNDVELTEFTSKYRAQFSVHFQQEGMVDILKRAEVLKAEGNDQFRFKHRFVYYYFVAKYFAMNMYRESERRKLRVQLNQMAERIYVEDFYFILLFLVYLTNDEKLVAKLAENGSSFYDEHDPCDLDKHVEHINQLGSTLPPLSLGDGNVAANRDKFEGERNNADLLSEQAGGDESGDLEEQRQLDDLMKIRVAFRTLQIMGSVLRNFPGMLEGEVKRKLALESYHLGLRILKFMLLVVEQNAEYFRDFVAQLVQDRYGIHDEVQLGRRANALMFELQAAVGYGVIKKISQAVGSRHLKETYREVVTENNKISVRMIDTAVKLDHFINFPKDEVLSLKQDVERNNFTYAILRTLVRDRFRLFTEGRKVRESICSQLDINMNDPKMIEGKTKK